MKRLFTIGLMLTLAVITASAQRLSCFPPSEQAGTRQQPRYSVPEVKTFDPQKTYRQPVILVACSDADFSMADPANYYHRILNEKGYNEGVGLGCAADYIRDQSEGRLNIKFDIYGPVKLDSLKAGGHGSYYYGEGIKSEAVKKLCETETTDFSIYDWDGDGEVDQVLFIIAGYTGNLNKGYTWPNTGWTFGMELPGGVNATVASITCELWKNDTSCGIGTILHELFHALGLPDVYPMGSATAFSAVDEWDLMDGGNYTNYGWCPPNLSTMEKMMLKWGDPIELTSATTVTAMKPLSDSGDTYIIRNPANRDEYYLLENRQQKGWDIGCPGNGLLIFHVDYDYVEWKENNLNISDTHYRYSLFHADGKDYRSWDPTNNGKDDSKWADEGHLHNKYLSTSAYPYTNPETLVINASLTNDSNPAATLFTANTDGLKLMSKPITNIQMASDGTISFDFMKEASGIHHVQADVDDAPWYDLQGRRLQGRPIHKGLYIHNGKKESIR